MKELGIGTKQDDGVYFVRLRVASFVDKMRPGRINLTPPISSKGPLPCHPVFAAMVVKTNRPLVS
jgi:hypothetical protein